MLKKIIALLFLFLFINILILYKPKIVPAFKETEIAFYENDYNMYNINVENANVTTKNIMDYFKDIDIIGITPYIDKIYEHKIINEIGYYEFGGKDINYNINNFINKYISVLNKNGINSIPVNVNGIRIKLVKIYTNEDILNELLLKNIKFKR